MRTRLLPIFILAALAAGCERPHAPASVGSALPPPPDTSVAQAVPAGGSPLAAPASVAVAAPAKVPASAVAAAAPGAAAAPSKTSTPAAAAQAPRNDPRWRDVDPAELASDPSIAAFEAEQRKRDAELMARDAAEATARAAGGDDGRDDRDDPRFDDPRYAPEVLDPFARGPYDDERGRAPYRDGPYGDAPPPYDEDDGYYDPRMDEAPYDPRLDDYDPRLDDGYDPRYEDDYRR